MWQSTAAMKKTNTERHALKMYKLYNINVVILSETSQKYGTCRQGAEANKREENTELKEVRRTNDKLSKRCTVRVVSVARGAPSSDGCLRTQQC